MRGGKAAAVALMAALALNGAEAAAGPIERACLGSDRAGSAPLCRCIQRVADATLRRGEQRMAARFFREPHRAQEIRQSDSPRHEAFWQRYKYFGSAAELNCG